MSISKLRMALLAEDIDKAAEAINNLCKIYGKEWVKVVKINGILPEPLSRNFSVKPFLRFLQAAMRVAESPKIAETSEVLYSAIKLVQSDVQLAKYIVEINDRLSRCEFLKLPPAKQVQILCIAFEDQARLLQLKGWQSANSNQSVEVPNLFLTPQLRSLGGADSSVVDAFEGIGDSFDTNLRYILWKFGNQMSDACDNSVSFDDLGKCMYILQLGSVRNMINSLWQNIKFRDWKPLAEEQRTIFCPCSVEGFLLEEASVFRYQFYLYELMGSALSIGHVRKGFEHFTQTVNSIGQRIKFGNATKDWINMLPESTIREAMETESPFEVGVGELFARLYKTDFSKLVFGDKKSGNIGATKLLTATKFLYILAKAYRIYSDKIFHQDDPSTYHVLVPIIGKSKLAKLLTSIAGWHLSEAENALRLLTFDRVRSSLDIWSQPLIPIGKNDCILVPSIVLSLNLHRLFECHLAQWDIGFDERGTIFENDIRASLKSHGIPVVSMPLKFIASDGQPIELDVIALFDDFLLLIEAKCLRNPYSHAQRYSAWKEIQKGIKQVNRSKRVVQSDWATIRQFADIQLPPVPLAADRVLGIVLTNIFTFTGMEVDGVRVADSMCLYKYLTDPDIKLHEISKPNGIVRTLDVARLWKGNRPAPLELWEYIKKPTGLARIVDSMYFDLQEIPRLDSTDPVICFPFAQIGDMKGGIWEIKTPLKNS